MGNRNIALIDSGISSMFEFPQNIIKSFYLLPTKNSDGYTLIEESPVDFIGHGTAVAHIICTENTDASIINFRICGETMDVPESGLIFILEFILDNNEKFEISIINVSLGCTYLYNHQRLKYICAQLEKKGILVISAFDNDGAISFPAALDEVIGVDTYVLDQSTKDLAVVKDSIVDVLMPDSYYRTFWGEKKAIIKGTSFATAKLVGIISKIELIPSSKEALLEQVSRNSLDVSKGKMICPPPFKIKKAIVFPVNKESNAILRFKEMLDFEIVGVYDEPLSGNVGKKLFGETVYSYNNINWTLDFDTIIVSCTFQLSSITKKQYLNEILERAKTFEKNVYTFEPAQHISSGYYYPAIDSSMVPNQNMGKLHKVTIPVVGVFGTSSKQGKYTLQLELKRQLQDEGYSVAHIATEPSGYLFNADFVFHFGYRANLKLQAWQVLSILNEMVWQSQLRQKDILITGCQSGTVHYAGNCLNDYPLEQYTFALGTLPDYIILCVNPHDEIAYINKTIQFLNSIDEGSVEALVMYPVSAVETLTKISYKLTTLSIVQLAEIKKKFSSEFGIPVFCLDSPEDLKALTKSIITFFAQEE